MRGKRRTWCDARLQMESAPPPPRPGFLCSAGAAIQPGHAPRGGSSGGIRQPWTAAAAGSRSGQQPLTPVCIATVHLTFFFFFLRIFLFFVFSQDNTVNTFTGRDLAACVLDSNQFRLQIRYFLFSLSNFLLSICFLSLPFMDKLYGVY